MKVQSLEIELHFNPLTGCWGSEPAKNGDDYGYMPDVSLEVLTMLADPDMQPSSAGNNSDFLTSSAEQERQRKLLADLRKVMGTD